MLSHRGQAASTILETKAVSNAVVVCGGGAAGIATSLAAARNGAEVWLVEPRSRLGGTVTHSLIHTLAGIFDSRGQMLQEGLVAELVARLTRGGSARRRRMGRLWALNVPPEHYEKVVEEWIAELSQITVCRRSVVSKIGLYVRNAREGGRVASVEVAGPAGPRSLLTDCVVDTTGTGEIVRSIDPRLVQDDRTAAAGLIVRLRGMTPGMLDFPQGLGVVRLLREAADNGTLPASCGQAWIDTGCYPDEAFVKLLAAISEDEAPQRLAAKRQAERDGEAILGFLKNVRGFSSAKLAQCGELGIRDGGRVQGEYVLTKSDVQQLRKFEDAACRACWPIEYWDPRQGVSLEYLPDDGYYEIPLRCLRVKGWSNVWVAGKCLSADPYAQASARVVGTCWAMGGAVGRAAVTRRATTGSANEFATI